MVMSFRRHYDLIYPIQPLECCSRLSPPDKVIWHIHSYFAILLNSDMITSHDYHIEDLHMILSEQTLPTLKKGWNRINRPHIHCLLSKIISLSIRCRYLWHITVWKFLFIYHVVTLMYVCLTFYRPQTKLREGMGPWGIYRQTGIQTTSGWYTSYWNASLSLQFYGYSSLQVLNATRFTCHLWLLSLLQVLALVSSYGKYNSV